MEECFAYTGKVHRTALCSFVGGRSRRGAKRSKYGLSTSYSQVYRQGVATALALLDEEEQDVAKFSFVEEANTLGSKAEHYECHLPCFLYARVLYGRTSLSMCSAETYSSLFVFIIAHI